MALFYADASALVKLVCEESETAALGTFLAGADIISSELVLTEVPRAVHRAASEDPALPLDALMAAADDVVQTLALLPVDRALLLAAGALAEPMLRALDAIHIASAVTVLPIDAFVTYDDRQGAAARLAGLRTVGPG
ncbi:MAG TPA: type II toxin-antitoxin system VapC family toxin [Baekduia sp.]|uniref:type II toxin-antitoxin system VapC family toxin n=1 Tax=Baekduia sp. TaxID=2600305 RepID=UPI002C30988F|nr:type II toxin-antitoxin system VapC family toxin [Baekduia sp.]HMJ35533.1 type II toxin-antitoxin system VapC family toxin [Baekduia sp.]